MVCEMVKLKKWFINNNLNNKNVYFLQPTRKKNPDDLITCER